MRFNEFKNVNPSKMITEVSNMSPGEWKATSEPQPVKYVKATANSIATGKYFQYRAGAGKNAPEKTGIVDKITVNDQEISSEDWETYALNNYPEFVKDTLFHIDGDAVPLNKLLKNEAVSGSLKPNKGDIAEAVLGSAITAKFKNGGRPIKEIDVVNILKEVVSQGVSKGVASYETPGVIDDEYQFTLTLNAASLKPLKIWMEEEDPMASPADFRLVKEFEVDTDTIDALQLQIKHAVEYANKNRRAQTAVDKAKTEMEDKNEVNIISDGGDATQQSITKVDLKLQYDDENPLSLLSLKAGSVKQFGQISGAEWESVSDFFESIFKFRLPDEMKSKFGFKDKTDPGYKEHNYNNGPFAKLYDEMAKQVMEYTNGDDTTKEFNLVRNVYNAINFHATRGEEGVTMVILSPTKKKAYKELAFDHRLLSALELYDLQVSNDFVSKNHRINIVGHLKQQEAAKTLGKANAKKLDSKSILVQLRSSVQGGAIRNIVEMGELLKELANVEKLDKENYEQSKLPAAPKAAKTAPAKPAPQPAQQPTQQPAGSVPAQPAQQPDTQEIPNGPQQF